MHQAAHDLAAAAGRADRALAVVDVEACLKIAQLAARLHVIAQGRSAIERAPLPASDFLFSRARRIYAVVTIRPSVDATDYIQLYDGNSDTLRQSLHRIQATAKTILSALPLETPAVAAQTRLAC